MSIIAGLIGLLFMLTTLAGFVFFAIFIARKIGLLKPSTEIEGVEGVEGNGISIKSYLGDIKKLSESLVFRFIFIAILIGVMSIPTDMVNKIVSERSHLYQTVINDIASTWGHQQKLQGPALLIPYTEKFVTETIKTDKDGNERKVNKVIYKQQTAIVLPDDLKIDVNLEGQTRKRSLYESLVYTAELKLTGDFTRPNINDLSNHIDEIHWDQAWIALGISDTQAINKVSALSWAYKNTSKNTSKNKSNQSYDFEPGTKILSVFPSGFHAPIDLTQTGDLTQASNLTGEGGDVTVTTNKNEKYDFALNININGSQGFYFSPFGKTTDVTIKSDWPHPSFQGNVLPDNHNVSKDGFVAFWSVPNLARNYPQRWTLEKQDFNVNEFTAGVNLFEAVSLYSQVTRAIKYSVLFFALTYITFLIFELGIGRRLHVVQYGIIGLALSMFYLTLLSMAEHAGFFTAYVSAASIIILMISLYAYAAIRSIGKAGIITVLLSGLYAMLYSLLKLEDYALMAGTVLLLIILAVLMILTRNIGARQDS